MATQGEILKEIVGRALLLRVGNHAVAIIKTRVAQGIFGDGSDENASKYSDKPFAMPVGAIKKKSVLMEILKGKVPDESQLFKTKAGKLWVVIKHGYEWLRKESGKPSDKVDMRWSSEMMRSLTVLDANPATGEITIGHKGALNEQLSQWHHQGAGKSKKVRKWLYLTEKELGTIAEGN